jgi:hypothetical protein
MLITFDTKESQRDSFALAWRVHAGRGEIPCVSELAIWLQSFR